MRPSLAAISTALLVLSLSACGGGVESAECKAYFEAVETCAAKNEGVKGDAIRKTAEVSKEQFKKNANPMAVKKSCELMKQTLDADPACQDKAE